MAIIGINLGSTRFGKNLKDGGLCIVEDCKVKFAIAEERLSRIKRDGGFERSIRYALDYVNLRKKDIDLIVYSSCCEPLRHDFKLTDFQNIPTIPCSHHFSHALSVYFTSPFDEAIILVLDAGGNVLELDENTRWWESKREQQSYYIARGNEITPLSMDFYMPRSAGIAEVYRAFAYFLGWPSSNYANKVMALSALARGELFKEKYIFFVDKQNNMQSDIENNPSTPESTLYMVSSLLRKHGFKGIVPRKPNDSFRECHIDLAAWVQDETERAIFSKVNSLIRQTGITNICISGGVAYNCLAIGKMLGNTIAKNVFIHPASGDHGQCLGNAIYGHIHVFGKWKNRQRFTPYLGGEEALTINKIGCAIKAYPFLRAIEDENIANEVAKLLAQGKIVAWFQGRSEYGPRALGNRSILANPSIQILGERLNITKGRESFMPFAPSVIAEKTGEFFELPFDSPYMAAAFRTRMGKAKEIPSVVHVDGSSRIQQVEKGDNFLFYNLIDEFRKLTSIPLVLNTSFNGSGEPIVENFDDALKTFINLDIDYLAAGPFLIEKEKRYKESLMIRAEDDAALIFDLNSGSIADLKISLHKQFPFARLVPRKRFLLYSKYLDWLREGRKATTIRFNRNGIELPSGPVVPLFSTDSVKPGAKEVAAGQVRINRVVVKHFGKLSKCDALNDGFNDLDELTRVMQEIYGNISADDCVSVYSIQLIRP